MQKESKQIRNDNNTTLLSLLLLLVDWVQLCGCCFGELCRTARFAAGDSKKLIFFCPDNETKRPGVNIKQPPPAEPHSIPVLSELHPQKGHCCQWPVGRTQAGRQSHAEDRLKGSFLFMLAELTAALGLNKGDVVSVLAKPTLGQR